MSGVAQRAGQVDIGAAAAVSRWEGTGRADYASGISASPPATMSGQYGRSRTSTKGSTHMVAFSGLRCSYLDLGLVRSPYKSALLRSLYLWSYPVRLG